MKINFNSISVRCLLIGQAVLAFSVFLTGCANSNMTHISRDKLTDEITSGSPLTIVDVRSSDEYKSGHISGAISIPYWSVFTRHSNIPSAHDEPIIIYCEHGPRAKLAKLALKIVGFEKVVYLEGHMTSWKKANLPVEIIGE